MVVPIRMRTHVLHSVASHIISLQLYLRVPGTNIPSLLSLILYSLFHLEENFFFPARTVWNTAFVLLAWGICFLSTGAMSFVSKAFHVSILTRTAHEIDPVKEESQKGLKKPTQGLEALLMLENVCHKLLPASYQKQFFFFHEEGKVGASFSSPHLLCST